ncbi:methyltransferase domain-containing protein [Aureitalea sp. L0-47]|uniref:methyltransferase domain-containing protein n=1 Tax=Aureitalea sp. L0-47 TaxID=2816962 RepID=UPI002237E890|nr:methyltransferase domain-containing protein [Aureitalea sp. L0-47]MCW5519381.1 methyltransferase domain-containing protein [Aureitalea sp. L0-47]
MIRFSSKYRSDQEEIMDDMDFGGEEMPKLLDDLRRVNKWLGGNSGAIAGIKKLVKSSETKKEIKIIDLGCGDGEMLRVCSDVLNRKEARFTFIGVDGNPHIIEEAEKRSENYPNIEFRTMDVFSSEMDELEYDIALFSLFLHHLKDGQISELLKNVSQKAKVGLVINDLERSRIAFELFKIVSTLFVRTRTAKIDGLISIARGFRKKELIAISQEIKANHSIRWWWAFRYQWIIQKI